MLTELEKNVMTMQEKNNAPSNVEKVAWGRFVWVAPLAIVASIVINLALAAVSRAIFNIPQEFMPFSTGNVVFFTTVGTGLAALAFLLVGWLSKRPFSVFRWVAGVGLVISWLPDIGLLMARPFPGITVPGVLTLMFLHVVSAAIVVASYFNLARAR